MTTAWALPPACQAQREKLSRWSKNDPVMQQSTKPDHWTKMKLQAMTNVNANGEVERHPGEMLKQLREFNRGPRPENTFSSKQGPHGDGRVSPRGSSVFGRVVTHNAHGNVPGNYTIIKPPSSSRNSARLRTAYNQRAKEGHKYWYQERPKPTNFGRYGMGCQSTTLGLKFSP